MPVLLLRHLDKRTQWKAVTGDSFTLGFSESATVPVPDEGLAAREVKVTKAGDRYLLRDLAEKDRVLLNGVVAREGLLKDGDQLRIGRIAVLFFDDAPAPGEIRFFPGDHEGDLEGERWETLEAASSAQPPRPEAARERKQAWKGVPAACLLGAFAAGVAFGVLGLRSPVGRETAPRPKPAEPTAAAGTHERPARGPEEAPIPAPAADPAPRPEPAPLPEFTPARTAPEPPATAKGEAGPPPTPTDPPPPADPPVTAKTAEPLPEPAAALPVPPPEEPAAGAPRVLVVALAGTLARDELSPHSRSAARTLWEIALAGVTATRVDFSGALSGAEAPGAAGLRRFLWSDAARAPDLLEADSLQFHLLAHRHAALIHIAAAGASPEEVASRDALLRRIAEAAGSDVHLIVAAVPRAGEGAVFARGPLLRSGWVIDQTRTSALVRALVGRALGKLPPEDPAAQEALDLFQ